MHFECAQLLEVPNSNFPEVTGIFHPRVRHKHRELRLALVNKTNNRIDFNLS